MPAVVVICRFASALVFAVSAGAKSADRSGTRNGFLDFGIPAAIARVGVFLLPLVELTAATLLVIPATSVIGAVTALVLLAMFTVGIAANLGRGRRPVCHCFGRLSAGPISASTIRRNVVFAVPVLIIILHG